MNQRLMFKFMRNKVDLTDRAVSGLTRGKGSEDTVGETLLNALRDLNCCRSLSESHWFCKSA